MTERLDKALVSLSLTRTRSLAQDAIRFGQVSVNGKTIEKSSTLIDIEKDEVILTSVGQSFASRAGHKLQGALTSFQIDLQGRIVMDVGASTGGFTDVCLQAGAAFVYALDVGHDQLLESLRQDARVKNLEGINCRYLESSLFDQQPDFACIDVSFISIKQILPSVLEQLGKDKEMVLLIKPQFEAGSAALNKHGIVKAAKVHRQVLQDMLSYIEVMGLFVWHLSKSSLCGRDGNQEFVMHISKLPNKKVFDVFRIVAEEI